MPEHVFCALDENQNKIDFIQKSCRLNTDGVNMIVNTSYGYPLPVSMKNLTVE